MLCGHHHWRRHPHQDSAHSSGMLWAAGEQRGVQAVSRQQLPTPEAPAGSNGRCGSLEGRDELRTRAGAQQQGGRCGGAVP